jgi:hypothetical protein
LKLEEKEVTRVTRLLSTATKKQKRQLAKKCNDSRTSQTALMLVCAVGRYKMYREIRSEYKMYLEVRGATFCTGLLILHNFLYQAMILNVIRGSPGRRKERGGV